MWRWLDELIHYHPDGGDGGATAQAADSGGGGESDAGESNETPEAAAAARHDAYRAGKGKAKAGSNRQDGDAAERDGGSGGGDGGTPTPKAPDAPTPKPAERPTLTAEQTAAAKALKIGEATWEAVGVERTLEMIDAYAAMRKGFSTEAGKAGQSAGAPAGGEDGGADGTEGGGDDAFGPDDFYDPATSSKLNRYVGENRALGQKVAGLERALHQIEAERDQADADAFFADGDTEALGVYGKGPGRELSDSDPSTVERAALMQKARALRAAEASEGHVLPLGEALRQASLIRDAAIRERKLKARAKPAKPVTYAPGNPGRGYPNSGQGKTPEQLAAEKHEAWRHSGKAAV